MFIATCFDSCELSSGYTRTIFIAYIIFMHVLGNEHKYHVRHKYGSSTGADKSLALPD